MKIPCIKTPMKYHLTFCPFYNTTKHDKVSASFLFDGKNNDCKTKA